MDVARTVGLTVHPVLGLLVAAWLWRQAEWQVHQRRLRDEALSAARARHERDGPRLLATMSLAVGIALIADLTFLTWPLGPLGLSVHGWLGLVTWVLLIVGWRHGRRVQQARAAGTTFAATRARHRQWTRWLPWLGAFTAVLGFLRWLEVIA